MNRTDYQLGDSPFYLHFNDATLMVTMGVVIMPYGGVIAVTMPYSEFRNLLEEWGDRLKEKPLPACITKEPDFTNYLPE